VSDTQTRLDVIRQRSAELEDEYWGQRDFRDERTCVSHLARAAAIVDAELERVTAALREAALHQGLPEDADPDRIAAHFRNNREYREGWDALAGGARDAQGER
jgi:hypothetical protein